MVAPLAGVHAVKPLSDTPLVSIVTPSLNQARFLERTLRSVREQEYPAIEHIVVDGCSTDETVTLLERHPGLRWLSEPDSGQAEAVNKGISLARGEIVGWLNADDFYLSGAVAKAVAVLKGNPECGFVYSNWVDVGEDGAEIRRNQTTAFDLEHQVNRANLVPQPTAFMRREALDEVGLLDESYHLALDYDLWIRLGQRFLVRYVDDYWAAFRLHDASKSVARKPEFWREQREISRRHGGRLLSGLLLTYWYERYPRAGRILFRGRSAARMLRAREFRRFAGRVRGVLLGLLPAARRRHT
jgi:glycosyltransferase involved in cell wall biosynthesis